MRGEQACDPELFLRLRGCGFGFGVLGGDGGRDEQARTDEVALVGGEGGRGRGRPLAVSILVLVGGGGLWCGGELS